jgi:hypothetical protein
VFEKNAIFAENCQKLQKTVIITSTPGNTSTSLANLRGTASLNKKMSILLRKILRLTPGFELSLQDTTATFFLLLDMMTFFDLFNVKKFDEAIDIIQKIKVRFFFFFFNRPPQVPLSQVREMVGPLR